MSKIVTEKKVKTIAKMNKVSDKKDYRFNIHKRLSDHTPEAKKRIIKSVAKNSNSSMATVRNLVYRKLNDDTTIKYQALKAWAAHFLVSIEQLEN